MVVEPAFETEDCFSADFAAGIDKLRKLCKRAIFALGDVSLFQACRAERHQKCEQKQRRKDDGNDFFLHAVLLS
ncbi:hypothetical protein SDC9_109412 [bioreactor metagenome]|uniref:Uncharacterized protein n=1 Tax=bioreactor metagenome TaxID=1076179 RepID=A0A645BAN5_9ZZZZ